MYIYIYVYFLLSVYLTEAKELSWTMSGVVVVTVLLLATSLFGATVIAK